MLLVEQTKADLDSIGIPYRQVRNWSVNTRAQKRWGQCRNISGRYYDINISSRLLEDGVEDQAVKNVIAHELLHTVNGCFGHLGKWKYLAGIINSCLPSYQVRTTSTGEELGVSPARSESPKYIIICTKCGYRVNRYRRSKVIDHPNRYRCPNCNGKIKVFDNN